MSSKTVRPSTMTGIKRLANQIKSAEGLSHSAALDKASLAAGFENIRHAQHHLSARQPLTAVPRHPVYLTAYWRDLEAGVSGRETLTITLNAPWHEFLTPSQLKSARGIESFTPEGPDHLVRRNVVSSQSVAREAVCHAARTLQFVAATELRPSSGYCRAYPNGNADSRIPGQDHVCVWFDREKRYLIADEPYEAAEVHQRQDRAAWFHTHGYREVKARWLGMHNPYGGTRLFLVADSARGVPLDPIIDALNQLPAPHSAADWKGESAPRLPYFVSPGAAAKAKAEHEKKEEARARPKPTGRNPNSSISYTRTIGGHRDRRPNARMPVEVHTRVGSLLKSVLVATYNRKGVYNRINAVRCELDDWVQREYNGAELPNEQFFGLYYHESGSTFARRLPPEDRAQHVSSLVEVKKRLAENYPECPPLRSMLKRLDGAITSLSGWTS